MKYCFWILIIILFLLPGDTEAVTYYVRDSDSCGTCGDGEDGLSPSTAWVTIGNAVDNMVAGDSVWIGGGDFSDETMTFTDKDYGSWTHFLGDYDGSQTGDVGKPEINAVCGNTDWGRVHLSHLYFKGKSACVWTGGIIFINGSTAERLKIEHCVVETAVAISTGYYIEFTNNFVKDQGSSGATYGFYAACQISHYDTAYIYNNTMRRLTTCSDCLVLYCRGASGDQFWIKNNIFSKIDASSVGYMGLQDYDQNIYKKVDNNYFDEDHPVGQFSGQKSGGSWTWYDDLAEWQGALDFDTLSQVGEADDQLEADGFHLSDGSACIDTGWDASTYVTDDIDGDSRPNNDIFDVGCDEYIFEIEHTEAARRRRIKQLLGF